MNAEVHSALDAGLLTAWRDLAEVAGSSPFAGPDWHLARHETYGPRGVRYLVARDGGSLLGIWPLEFGGIAVHPAGNWLADYLSPLLAPGRAGEVLESFAAWFRRSGVMILDLPRLDAAYPSLVQALSRSGYRLRTLPGEVCPALDLSGGVAGVEGRLPSGLRKRWRYDARRLAREAPVEVDFVPPLEVPEAMATLMAWHTARFRSRGTPGSFFGRRRAFHERVAARHAAAGLLRLSRLRLGGRTIALLYALRGGERCYYYAAGFDPDMARFSPGRVLLGETIRLAAAEGVGTFDFLRGDEEYKRAWASERRRLQRIVAASPGRYGYLTFAAVEHRAEMALRSRFGS